MDSQTYETLSHKCHVCFVMFNCEDFDHHGCSCTPDDAECFDCRTKCRTKLSEHVAVDKFIDSHRCGLVISLYDAIDKAKKDSVRYFIETIVRDMPEKKSEIFCEIMSRVGLRSRMSTFNDEYIFPILQYLLDNGADINHPNFWGYTPLMTSISFATIEMQLFLMAVPTCNLNYKNYNSDFDEMTPLLMAIRWGNIDSVLSLILDPRTDVNLSNSKYSPLSLAQLLKNEIIVEALLDHGANL